MKKTVLAAALALSLCVPGYATEQYQPNSSEETKNSYPVFGNEDQMLANMGIHDDTVASKQSATTKKTEAKVADKEKNKTQNQAADNTEDTEAKQKFAPLANDNQDDDIELETGRVTKERAQRNLAETDPNYVPPEKNKNRKKHKDQVDTSTLPIYLNGDHVEFENASGDFLATGHVRMNQGSEVVLTNYAFGNMKSGDIYLLEGGTLLEPGTRLEGKWVHYNYNTKTGEMKQVEGRGQKDFFKAPHTFVLPDKVVADQGGMTTRCTAQKHVPCMHVEAKQVEFYPKEKMVAHEVKVFVKGKHIYSRKLWINEFSKDKDFIRGTVGYDGSHNGWYIKLHDNVHLTEKDSLNISLLDYSRTGFKPMYKLRHEERNWRLTYKDGWEEDDDYWYKKQNDWRLEYKPHHFMKGLPLSYSAYFEYGLWSNYHYKNNRLDHKSWRREYAYYINHDPIKIFGPDTTLHLTYGRKWIYESYTDDQVTTNMYYATIRQKVDSNKRLWVSYLREKRQSTLFDIGQADMDRELRIGIQWNPTKNDSLSIVNRYDVGDRTKHYDTDGHYIGNTRKYETTYNWYHRFCCWALQLSYEKEWYKDDHELKLQYFFYNW